MKKKNCKNPQKQQQQQKKLRNTKQLQFLPNMAILFGAKIFLAKRIKLSQRCEFKKGNEQ